MYVLTEDYINPFKVDVDKQRLVWLSSGVLVPDEVFESPLFIEEMGAKQHEEFLEKQIQSSPSFHLPIKKNKVLGSKSMAKNTSFENGRNSVDTSRDILPKLFRISLNEDKHKKFETALQYQLSEVCHKAYAASMEQWKKPPYKASSVFSKLFP